MSLSATATGLLQRALDMFDIQPHNMPAVQVSINGKDRTEDVCARFISLSLTDLSGFEADTLTLTLDDADGALTLPETGHKIRLSIGWVGSGVVDKGEYTIDDIEHSGVPDIVTLTARSTEFCGELTKRRERSFHATTLGKIVETIAKTHGWTLYIEPSLAQIPIDHIDQQGESDANLLTRLAQEHDATATVKDRNLIVLPKGVAKTASGADIPPIVITRAVGDGHHFRTTRAEQYTGVVANWHDSKTGKRKRKTVKRKKTTPAISTASNTGKRTATGTTEAAATSGKNDAGTRQITVGDTENIYTLPHTYASEKAALNAAKAKWAQLQRAAASLSLTLAYGRADLLPLQPLQAVGFKAEIDANNWYIKQCTHTIDASGYRTGVECESAAVSKDNFEVT